MISKETKNFNKSTIEDKIKKIIISCFLACIIFLHVNAMDEQSNQSNQDSNAQSSLEKQLIDKIKEGDVENVGNFLSGDRIIDQININYQDKEGWTPIMDAVCCGNNRVAMVELLLKQFKDKIDINIKNNHKETAFTIAVRVGNIELVNLLIESFDEININDRDCEGYTSIMDAVYFCNDNVEVLKLLLENYGNEIDINIKNDYGETHLLIAAQFKNVDIVECLLQFYKKKSMLEEALSKRDHYGQTVLLNAAEQGNKEILQLFLEEIHKNDIDINQSDNLGRTVLMLAVSFLNTETVEYLLQFYKEKSMLKQVLSERDKYGNTVFSLAVETYKKKIVQLFLDKPYIDQININERNFREETFLMQIINYWNVIYWNNIWASDHHDRLSDRYDNIVEIISLLITSFKDKIDINARDYKDRTALMLAANGGEIYYDKIISLLFSHEKIYVDYNDYLFIEKGFNSKELLEEAKSKLSNFDLLMLIIKKKNYEKRKESIEINVHSNMFVTYTINDIFNPSTKLEKGVEDFHELILGNFLNIEQIKFGQEDLSIDLGGVSRTFFQHLYNILFVNKESNESQQEINKPLVDKNNNLILNFKSITSKEDIETKEFIFFTLGRFFGSKMCNENFLFQIPFKKTVLMDLFLFVDEKKNTFSHNQLMSLMEVKANLEGQQSTAYVACNSLKNESNKKDIKKFLDELIGENTYNLMISNYNEEELTDDEVRMVFYNEYISNVPPKYRLEFQRGIQKTFSVIENSEEYNHNMNMLCNLFDSFDMSVIYKELERLHNFISQKFDKNNVKFGFKSIGTLNDESLIATKNDCIQALEYLFSDKNHNINNAKAIVAAAHGGYFFTGTLQIDMEFYDVLSPDYNPCSAFTCFNRIRINLTKIKKMVEEYKKALDKTIYNYDLTILNSPQPQQNSEEYNSWLTGTIFLNILKNLSKTGFGFA
jgi:ankyrin repeat protein